MTASPLPAPRFRRAEVRRHGGVPTLHVEGRPIHGMTATSTAFDDPAVIEGFVRGGAEVMMIWIEAPLKCWRGPGAYDWSYAEEVLARFERHAGATHWLIRVRLGLVAAWFGEAHPGEVHHVVPRSAQQPHGMAVSVVHSPVWLAHVAQVLRDFVAWLAGTRWASRIIGFMLNAGSTEEWLPFDVAELTRGQYHPVYQREFRRWLRGEYRDAAALGAAWATHEVLVVDGRSRARAPVDFDNATCPTGHVRKGSHIWGPYSLRDPREDRAAIDWYRFLSETLADALIACCRAVKEAAGTPIVCGGFHSYLWWESGVYSYIQEYGHALIQRLNASPWVDFVSDITSYDCRYPGGPSGYLGLPQSLNLHGKLHYTEVDLVTLQSLPDQWRAAWAAADTSRVPTRSAGGIIPERVWNWSCNYCGRDVDEQLALLRREHVRNLVSGTPYWWFDIRGRDYQRPELVDELARLSRMGRRAVALDRTSVAEVAFVCSETTPFHQAAMNGELARFELESVHGLLLDLCNRRWGMAGVPFDCYEIADLGHPDFPGDRYKLIVFVNCAHIPAAAEAGIRRWQGGGRTLCWTYAAGVVGDDGIVAERSEALIGTRLGWRCERQQIRVLVDGDDEALTEGGRALDYGTEGSVGPVFFADDRQARVLGRLRDGGEAAFTVREHGDWRSVYLAMVNFGSRLLRNLAAASGAHVWSTQDDAVVACRSLVGLHTATGGRKRLALPRPMVVHGEFGAPSSREPVDAIEFEAEARRTYAWWLGPG